MMLFFLLKIAVPPILVALMSLAARRWGPTVGGLLMGLPWMTGPVLFFLGLDKGGEFAVAACSGIQLGVVCICAFMLAYSATSIVAPWPFCLVAATIAFSAVVGSCSPSRSRWCRLRPPRSPPSSPPSTCCRGRARRRLPRRCRGGIFPRAWP